MGEERAAHCKHTFFILTNFTGSKFHWSCFRMLISLPYCKVSQTDMQTDPPMRFSLSNARLTLCSVPCAQLLSRV